MDGDEHQDIEGIGAEDQAAGLDPLDREAVELFLGELAPRLSAALIEGLHGALVDRLAVELLDRLQPGLGPMLIPAAVARAIAAAAPFHQSWYRCIPGPDELSFDVACQADGSLFLRLAWQGNVIVWNGTLRPAEPVRK